MIDQHDYSATVGDLALPKASEFAERPHTAAEEAHRDEEGGVVMVGYVFGAIGVVVVLLTIGYLVVQVMGGPHVPVG